jgi:hypothetical protein
MEIADESSNSQFYRAKARDLLAQHSIELHEKWRRGTIERDHVYLHYLQELSIESEMSDCVFNLQFHSVLESGFAVYGSGQMRKGSGARYDFAGLYNSEKDLILDGSKFHVLKYALSDLGVVPVALIFRGRDSECFIVPVKHDLKSTGTDIVVVMGNPSSSQIKSDLVGRKYQIKKWDRISRLLRSGKSVSVVIKRRPKPGKWHYLIDVTIDPEGSLPWPDPRQNTA